MPRRKKGQAISGWLILDKPYGISSTGALGKVRWLLDAQKGGHGGTLDPLATGVLPLAFGEATKTLPYVLEKSKTYQFEITFGQATTTADAEGDVIETSKTVPSATSLEQILPQFTGQIEQIPPSYSAIKVDGQRAYKKARQGEDVVLKPRQVNVHHLKLLRFAENKALLEACVSKGTYIRSLGVDIAKALATCGYISQLRRTEIGVMKACDAVLLEDIEKRVANLGGKGHIPPNLLLPTDWVLDDILACTVTTEEANQLLHGQAICLPNIPPGMVRVKTQAGQLLSLLKVASDGSTEIVRNFNVNNDIA